MDKATAESLGDKLAAPDLTDEEGTLLLAPLDAESEVEGFGAVVVGNNFEEIKVTYTEIKSSFGAIVKDRFEQSFVTNRYRST